MNQQEPDETPIPRTTIADLDVDAFAAYYRHIYDLPLESAEMPLARLILCQSIETALYKISPLRTPRI